MIAIQRTEESQEIWLPGYAALIRIPAISKSSPSAREFPARVRKTPAIAHDNFYSILFFEDLRTLREPLRIRRTGLHIRRQRRTTGQN